MDIISRAFHCHCLVSINFSDGRQGVGEGAAAYANDLHVIIFDLMIAMMAEGSVSNG